MRRDAAARERERQWVERLQELRDQALVDEVIEDICEKSIEAMTAYLGGYLHPEGCELIERMLREMPAFRLVYEDLIAAWQAPGVEREVSEAEVEAAYVRFRERCASRA